jgi:hypothetical protein
VGGAASQSHHNSAIVGQGDLTVNKRVLAEGRAAPLAAGTPAASAFPVGVPIASMYLKLSTSLHQGPFAEIFSAGWISISDIGSIKGSNKSMDANKASSMVIVPVLRRFG